MPEAPFEGWAMLELMGHRQRLGYVGEVEIAGGKMLRIDIPVAADADGEDKYVTEFYGAAAVYSLRPCAEDVVRDQARRFGDDPRPVRRLEYRDAADREDADEPDFG